MLSLPARPSPAPFRSRTLWSALLSLALGCGGLRAQSFTAADADTLFDAHIKAFYKEEGDHARFAESTEGGRSAFWTSAEQLEMVLDACERNRKPERMAMFTKLFHGFIADHGKTWEHNEYNDDIMWMVIACARAHLMKANPEFLEAARKNFDLCYKRAISPDLGGGLFWKTDNKSKNACVNGPGAIAAYLLYRATGQQDYLAKAKEIYQWERKTLFEPQTGRVYDSIHLDGKISRFSLTYNQGTFTGAANLLGHPDDAKLAATFTMNELCRDGYLPGAGEKGDSGGFNGIGVRWIARYMKDHHQEAAFEPWLRKNADAAWQARRAADNLTWPRWPQPTPEGKRYAWACSSAVVTLQAVDPLKPVK